MQSLSATSAAGVLLDLSGVLILLLAFACLGSKLFNRYVAYYGAQSVVLSFAAGVAAYTFGSIELWILAVLTLTIKGIGIPVSARRLLIQRLDLIGELIEAFRKTPGRTATKPEARKWPRGGEQRRSWTAVLTAAARRVRPDGGSCGG